MRDLDAGLHLEQLGEQVRRRAGARGAEAQRAGLVLGELDEIGRGLRRRRRIDHQHERHARVEHDRHQILHRIERQAFVDARIDRHGRRGRHQQRVAVRRRTGDRGRADVGPRARPVLDHERLAEPLLELRRDEARDHFHAAARTGRHHDRHRVRRIILRARRRRRQQDTQRGKRAQNDHGTMSHPTARSPCCSRCRTGTRRSCLPESARTGWRCAAGRR